MGFASRKSANDLAPITRAPSSGVRPRVLPLDAANDSEPGPESAAERVLDIDASQRAGVVPPVVVPRDLDFDDELQLEDAVPLRTDAALAVVLGFVVVAAGSLVAAFSVL